MSSIPSCPIDSYTYLIFRLYRVKSHRDFNVSYTVSVLWTVHRVVLQKKTGFLHQFF